MIIRNKILTNYTTDQNGGNQVLPVWKKEGKNLTPCIKNCESETSIFVKLLQNDLFQIITSFRIH